MRQTSTSFRPLVDFPCRTHLELSSAVRTSTAGNSPFRIIGWLRCHGKRDASPQPSREYHDGGQTSHNYPSTLRCKPFFVEAGKSWLPLDLASYWFDENTLNQCHTDRTCQPSGLASWISQNLVGKFTNHTLVFSGVPPVTNRAITHLKTCGHWFCSF